MTLSGSDDSGSSREPAHGKRLVRPLLASDMAATTMSSDPGQPPHAIHSAPASSAKDRLTDKPQQQKQSYNLTTTQKQRAGDSGKQNATPEHAQPKTSSTTHSRLTTDSPDNSPPVSSAQPAAKDYKSNKLHQRDCSEHGAHVNTNDSRRIVGKSNKADQPRSSPPCSATSMQESQKHRSRSTHDALDYQGNGRDAGAQGKDLPADREGAGDEDIPIARKDSELWAAQMQETAIKKTDASMIQLPTTEGKCWRSPGVILLVLEVTWCHPPSVIMNREYRFTIHDDVSVNL
jgi:hypothetical protein